MGAVARLRRQKRWRLAHSELEAAWHQIRRFRSSPTYRADALTVRLALEPVPQTADTLTVRLVLEPVPHV